MTVKKTTKKKTTSTKKPAGKKKTAGKRRPAKEKASFFSRLFRHLIVIVLFLMVSLGAGAGYYFIKHSFAPPEKVETRIVKAPGHEKPQAVKTIKPRFEVFPEEPAPKPTPPKPEPIPTKPVPKAPLPSGPAPEPPAPMPPPTPAKLPKVAIIIDDLGYDHKLGRKFLSIDAPLTYAVLPHSPYRREIANAAKLKGAEVMLHLPMEPDEYPEIDPGEGALLSSMTPDERIVMLKRNLDSVPFVSGVNNHMGSKMSANSEAMNQILSIVKKKGLYYVDSLTSSASRADSSARLFQVPFATRDVFLDHDPNPAMIRLRLEQLVHLAEVKGMAIGIAHPYEATYSVLAEMLPQLKGRVQFIPASEAVGLAGY
jgi:uncharacterized protein